MKLKTKIIAGALAVLSAVTLAGCTSAEIVDNNTTRDAQNFKIERRIVFFNGITDKYLLSIEGRCNIEDQGSQLEALCKVGDDEYKKHFLGLSDNVSYFIEQLEPHKSDEFHYEVQFRPEAIIPDINMETSTDIEGDGPADEGN